MDIFLDVNKTFIYCSINTKSGAGRWWLTPLIPALERLRQADLREFEASLVSTVSSRTAPKAVGKHCLVKLKKKKWA